LNLSYLKKNILTIIAGTYPLLMATSILFAEIISIFFILVSFFFLRGKIFLFFKNYYIKILIIFFLYLIFNSLLISKNISLSLERSLPFIRFILLIVAFSFLTFEKKIIKIELLINLWSITLLFLNLDLVYQYYNSENKDLFGFQSPYPGRLSGIMGEEMKIALILYGFGSIIISYFAFKKKFNQLIIFSFITLIGVFLTNERSNILKLIFILFFFFIFLKNMNFKKKIFIFFLTSFIILFFLTLHKPSYQRFVKEKIFNQFSYQDLKNKNFIEAISNSNYGQTFFLAYNIFIDNIVFGVGQKTFRVECQKYINTLKYYNPQLPTCSTHPHNTIIEIASELGLIGILIFFFIMYLVIFKLIRKNKHKDFNLMLGPILFMISQTLLPLPSGSFFTNYFAIIFWLNFAFVFKFLKN